MSDDKQLTVAELLARAGKEKKDADGARGGRGSSDKDAAEKPRRRRRRSMEDGGVSVAELTGSFPKVKAKPKESKHGSPIDEPSVEQTKDAVAPAGKPEGGKTAAGQSAAGMPEAGQSAAGKPAAGRAPSEGLKGGQPPASQGQDSSGTKASGKNAPAEKLSGSGKPATNAGGVEKPATKQQVTRTRTKSFTVNRKTSDATADGRADKSATAGAITNPGAGAVANADRNSREDVAVKPASKPEAKAKAESTATTESGTPGQTGKTGQGEPAATSPATKAADKPSPAADETAEISRVTDAHTGQEKKDASGKDRGDAETTGEIPKVNTTSQVKESANQAKTATQQIGQRAADDTSEIQKVSGAAAASAQQSKPQPRARGDQQLFTPGQSDQQSPVHAGADAEKEKPATEGEGMNPIAVILLALVGIVLGVVVFKGFEMLWGSLNNFLVAALAVGVTGVMAGVVHALRTERDGLSMSLAVIVGLLLTFGPAVLVVL